MSRWVRAGLAALALACCWHRTAAGGEGAAPPGWVAMAGGTPAGEQRDGWSLELADAPLRSVLERLARDCGWALEADRRVALERRMSLSAQGGEPESTLHHVLRATGLVLQPAAPGVMRVAPGALPGPAQDDPYDPSQQRSVAIVTGTASLLIDLPPDASARHGRAAAPSSAVTARAVPLAGPVPTNVRGAQLDWKIRPRTRVGSNFTVQIFLRTERPAASVPLTIAFDSDALEVIRIDAGDALGAQPLFSSHTDVAGVIALQGARSAAGAAGQQAGQPAGQEAAGLLAAITFRANRASEAATIQVTSAHVRDAAGAEMPTVIPFRHSMPVLP
ncbi:MAG: cohesin domain-containing protein [Burkholderiaceae bacterium]|nr:cohesin domain-containing protein [Burkholderiaceae bacterium]